MEEQSSELNVVRLYDSRICRLCAEENTNGYPLFCNEGSEPDISALINSYLPVKPRLIDDGKFPKWICPGCHLQVESTVQFFDLVVYGQEALKDLYIKNELEQKRFASDFSDEPYAEPATRRRGRPTKSATIPVDTFENKNVDEYACTEAEPAVTEDSSIIAPCRQRRKIKIPSRYLGSVQGKELEKVFIENGVIEQNDFDADEAVREFAAGTENQTVFPVEVIGHLQDSAGANLGDLVVLNSHISKMRKKSKAKKTRYMCDICKMCFTYELKFLQHRFSHQNVKFECTQCLRNFLDRESLIQHQLTEQHSGEGIIECIEPISTALGEESLVDPIENMSGIVQENAFPLTNIGNCEAKQNIENQIMLSKKSAKLMNKTSSINQTESESQMHSEEQLPDLQSKLNSMSQEEANKSVSKRVRYRCSICNNSFTKMQLYIYHRDIEHSDGRRFACSKCKKCFKTKSMLQRHQLVHSNARPFACNYCDASFKTKTHLFYHKRSHTGEKKHQCDICQQLFAHKNSLNLHMRSHTGYKPYKCSVCNKTFTQHGNMQEHMRIHTGECPFECHICGRKFKTSSQVRMHIKRHEVDKPLKCNLCEKSFVQIVELRNHQRRHNNIKPYSCEVCGKCFIDRSALKKHLRLHTGEKPFSCNECRRRFADPSNLKKHLRIHKNKRKDMEWMREHKNSNREMLMESLNEFNSTSRVDEDNFKLDETLSNSMAEDSSMWELIEEDVYLDGNSSNCLAPKNSLSEDQQLVNITYQDPDNPLISKTTLFVVQKTIGNVGCKNSHLENPMVLQESCNNDELVQSSNIFLTNHQGDTDEIQTVFLNIQNPININLGHACEIFSDNSGQGSMGLITNHQQNPFTNCSDSVGSN